ncbi:hypothetical protein MA16_Dca008528 [Dendrobium catenatum]|uniref:Uncharacterized protein n=1 Tax=Dendrobium catenatum TaxID=906689 RepID=A0A2I0XHP4_9ASPA|nr:hypothetical protein MA16_Dca008528 [Dendrobium catenatum]
MSQAAEKPVMGKPDAPPSRCPHCAGPLSKDLIGSAVGGTASAFYGFNHDHVEVQVERFCHSWPVELVFADAYVLTMPVLHLFLACSCSPSSYLMPVVSRWVKGPMWIQFLVGAPPVIVFSSACAGLAGGAVPALAQLVSSSCHSSMSSSRFSRSTSSQDDNMQKSRSSSTL